MENVTNLNITIDDGYRRVPINNQYGDEIGVFYFNPTDIGIIERYNTMAETFDSVTAPLDELEGKTDVTEEDQIAAIDAAKDRLFDAVDTLFGGNAAEAFFGKVHPFSPIGGYFYCELMLQQVGEFINAQFDVETEKMSARVKKYTNRAQRRAKK